MMRFGSAAPIFLIDAQRHRRSFEEERLLECGNEAFGICFAIRDKSKVQCPESKGNLSLLATDMLENRRQMHHEIMLWLFTICAVLCCAMHGSACGADVLEGQIWGGTED